MLFLSGSAPPPLVLRGFPPVKDRENPCQDHRSVSVPLKIRVEMLWIVFLLLPPFIQTFEFPEHRIEILKPKGFRVSVADVEGATLFAVHINVNEEMEGLEAGQFAVDIVKKKNGRWTYTNKIKTLKNGDKLYYWLYLIVDGLGYRLDDQQYTVTSAGDSIPPVIATTQKTPNCKASQTKLGASSACSGQVLFFDDFLTNLDNWSPEVKFSDGSETDFTIFTKSYGTSSINNGKLVIKPKLLEDVKSRDFVQEGTLNLEGCTSRKKSNCNLKGFTWQILPPVLSARLTTKNSFSFLYGEIEVKAKLPSGDWIVPELWLEPKVFYGDQSGRIVLGSAFGNPSLKDQNGIEIGSSFLHQGYSVNNRTVNFQKQKGAWTSGFHIYKLRWTSESLTFFVDGEEMNSVKPTIHSSLIPDNRGSPLAPFNREFFISLGLHVGGSEDFPDNSVSSGKPKPWSNTYVKRTLDFWQSKNDWFPTWQNPNDQLQVDYVKVTALSNGESRVSSAGTEVNLPEEFIRVDPKTTEAADP